MDLERGREEETTRIWRSLGGHRDALVPGQARPRHHRTCRELVRTCRPTDLSAVRRALAEGRIEALVDPEAMVTSVLAEFMGG